MNQPFFNVFYLFKIIPLHLHDLGYTVSLERAMKVPLNFVKLIKPMHTNLFYLVHPYIALKRSLSFETYTSTMDLTILQPRSTDRNWKYDIVSLSNLT